MMLAEWKAAFLPAGADQSAERNAVRELRQFASAGALFREEPAAPLQWNSSEGTATL